MTFKGAIKRGIYGIPLGVFITNTIALLLSNIKGESIMVMPFLLEQTNNMVEALWIQYVLSAFLGFVFCLLSVIYEIEVLSLLKQTIVHFFVSLSVFLVVSNLLGWSSISNSNSIILIVICFIGVYFLIWLCQFLYYYFYIRSINRDLSI